MLDSIPVLLIRDLENYVRNCQIQETPTVPRGSFIFTTDDSYLEVEDPEFSTSIFALSRGDGSVSKYDDTLVTLHFEKPSEKGSKNQVADIINNKITSPILVESRVSSPPTVRTDSGRMKKGVKVSLDNLENELHSLSSQPRRMSSGWASVTINDATE